MQDGTCLHPPSWQVYDSFSPLSFISDETCRVQLHIHNSSTTFSFGNVTCSPWVICTAPRLQSSLKAALRETGHCNGHEHRLEEKVPHHPHQEELISSLSKKHHTLVDTVDTTSLAASQAQLAKHWTRSSFSICSWVSPVHSKKSG